MRRRSRNCKQLLAELSEEERKSLPETVAEIIDSSWMSYMILFQQKEKELYDEIDHVLDNAYLMPFQTRDLAEAISCGKTA